VDKALPATSRRLAFLQPRKACEGLGFRDHGGKELDDVRLREPGSLARERRARWHFGSFPERQRNGSGNRGLAHGGANSTYHCSILALDELAVKARLLKQTCWHTNYARGMAIFAIMHTAGRHGSREANGNLKQRHDGTVSCTVSSASKEHSLKSSLVGTIQYVARMRLLSQHLPASLSIR
jgi:hypothetical protein